MIAQPTGYMISFWSMKDKTTLSVVVPVYNEEQDIPKKIPILYEFMKDNFKEYSWEIVIADNGPSRDRTGAVSRILEKKYKNIKYVLIPRPGRGNALKEVWLASRSKILCYMDVDLSSDLGYLSQLVGALEKGYDIAIGSRLATGARVYGRTLTREIMSRGYNILMKLMFWTSFHDAQCGFKAITREAAKKILPAVLDKGWFFDSELLIIAQKLDLRISEIPIVWRDDPRSTVKVAKTAWGDIKGLVRLFLTRPWERMREVGACLPAGRDMGEQR